LANALSVQAICADAGTAAMAHSANERQPALIIFNFKTLSPVLVDAD
jgi:hypothetical protein